MRRIVAMCATAAIIAGVMLWPVGGGPVDENIVTRSVPVLDLSPFSADPPGAPLRFLFIHHSCGGRWLAEPGPDDGERCIYRSHPQGGSLRGRLEADGYEVHEASYGSRIGAHTDIFDWPEKFRTDMDLILACDLQDRSYADGEINRIVAFKSCFPNNRFVAESAKDREGVPALTVPAAKAAYRELLPEFERRPEVLFVCVTAPPVAPKVKGAPLWKRLARSVAGRPSPTTRLAESGVRAREFNNWLKATDGWLADYGKRNVVVFDLYDVLTGDGASNLSRFATRDGFNSHPSREGFERATERFVPFLNRAVRRAGLLD